MNRGRKLLPLRQYLNKVDQCKINTNYGIILNAHPFPTLLPMSCLQSVEYRNYETLSRLTFQQIRRRIWLIHKTVWAFKDHGCNLWMKGVSLKAWKIILNIDSFKTCCVYFSWVCAHPFWKKRCALTFFLQTVTNKYYVFATNKGKHSRSLGGGAG